VLVTLRLAVHCRTPESSLLPREAASDRRLLWLIIHQFSLDIFSVVTTSYISPERQNGVFLTAESDERTKVIRYTSSLRLSPRPGSNVRCFCPWEPLWLEEVNGLSDCSSGGGMWVGYARSVSSELPCGLLYDSSGLAFPSAFRAEGAGDRVTGRKLNAPCPFDLCTS
jgi:hypothetical protein